MRSARAIAVIALLAVSVSGTAQEPSRPSEEPRPEPPASTAPAAPPKGGAAAKSPPGPRLRLGALLPVTGASAWYATEMRRGMELAIADLSPAPPRAQPTTPPPESPGPTPQDASGEPGGAPEAAPPSAPPAPAPALPVAPPPALQIFIGIVDVQPRDVAEAAEGFAQLAAVGATAVFTASATPTLKVAPLAAPRDILVLHQGFPSDRFPAQSQLLLHTRPSLAARGATLAAYAWERGIRRLAVLAAGDEFGKPVRAALSARWRDRGASLVHEESLTLEAPDLPTRIARVARLAPDAVCLAFRGQDLGHVARRLRDAGYRGLLLALDDDPVALLTAGPTLTDMVLLVDAFVPEPDSRSASFAKAYEKKYGRAPSRFAANAYDAVSILAEGARLALQDGRGIPGGARLRQTLLKRRAFPSVYGGQVMIRDDGSFDRPLALFTVASGRGVFVRYVNPSGGPVIEESSAPMSGRQWASAR